MPVPKMSKLATNVQSVLKSEIRCANTKEAVSKRLKPLTSCKILR
jgi:hypothetical protein